MFANDKEFSFSHPAIGFAVTGDLADLLVLVNSAYRGEVSRQGWTTEADLISGEQRIDEEGLKQILLQAESKVLIYRNEASEIVGTLNLQKKENKLYLGMFSVHPAMQNTGIGKSLLFAADEWAKYLGCSFIYMSVITVRSELIDWYKRHGYKDNGARIPFEEDGVSGKHLRQLEFMILEKEIIN
jgi:GNAT superfamily N-acetyltransferase